MADMIQPAPVDERPAPAGFHVEQHRATYAESIVPDDAALLALREKLRYRVYQRRGTLGRFMQRLGDFGRQYLFNPAAWPGRSQWW